MFQKKKLNGICKEITQESMCMRSWKLLYLENVEEKNEKGEVSLQNHKIGTCKYSSNKYLISTIVIL
jgi:hypothetical protein